LRRYRSWPIVGFLAGATPVLLENPMSQLRLPIFPDAVTPIKALLSVGKQDGQVVYFHGVLPVFSHAEEDLATFRMITAQFIEQGHLRVVDVSRAFGVPALSVKRALKCYRQEGPKGF